MYFWLKINDEYFSIIAKHVGKWESIFCRTPQIYYPGTWNVRLSIDGGETIKVGSFKFHFDDSPQINWMFPVNSSPARSGTETFREVY